ncbi:SOS response-associated peptidase [Rhabdobacter roseus]|uniref:Abasic site processing protein n=1 Tax=Rhabdobacter roseus TaxID=1655419 RepID=A0A840TQY3_9BACT|nr:SOS response-associated peptidase [Rhabdobacter roseus]MBB5285734.1 putative SOS response-associated peptidase YedK [Rhabdobacter roseus]
MCFYILSQSKKEALEERFRAQAVEIDAYEPEGKVSGFSLPTVPVITTEFPQHIQFMRWGLIPVWARADKADELARMTLNARSETLFEKPSFKGSIMYHRCLVLVDGFYEWRHEGKKKVPYFIRLQAEQPLALGGLYALWTHPTTHQTYQTCSIITTPANPLMTYIHNTKERMPFILPPEHERRWIARDLPRAEIEALMQPLPEELMRAEVMEG